MGDVQGPEKVNDTYMKTMHTAMLDKGFTAVSKSILKKQGVRMRIRF
jgi:hypothetical protein